ncbi:small subunit processome component 20 homolog [Ixodes scapularis]
MMLKRLEADPQYADGVGRLLYEAVKGVKGQTHSSMAAVLSPALRRLHGSVGSVDVNRQVLRMTLTCLAGHFYGQPPSSSAPVWQCLLDVVTKSVGRLRDGGDRTHLENLVATVRVWVDFKDGAMVRGSTVVPQILEAALGVGDVSAALTTNLFGCVAALLKACDTVSNLVAKVFSGDFPSAAMLDFTLDILDYSLFEKVVLAPLVRYAAQLEDESDALALLTEVVLRRRPVDLARPGGSSSRPLFDTGCSAVVTLSRVVARMLSLGVAGSLERVRAGLVCLPHFASPVGDDELEHVTQIFEKK